MGDSDLRILVLTFDHDSPTDSPAMCSAPPTAGKGIAGVTVMMWFAGRCAVADRPGHHHVFEILLPIAAVAFLF